MAEARARVATRYRARAAELSRERAEMRARYYRELLAFQRQVAQQQRQHCLTNATEAQQQQAASQAGKPRAGRHDSGRLRLQHYLSTTAALAHHCATLESELPGPQQYLTHVSRSGRSG